jgi:hypothetical protein
LTNFSLLVFFIYTFVKVIMGQGDQMQGGVKQKENIPKDNKIQLSA